MAQVNEILSGTIDGANVEFTSSQIPEWGSLHVYNIVSGVSTEVTVSSFEETTITLATAPTEGDLFAVYNVKPNEETALDLIADALIEINVGTLEDRENIAIADLNLGLRHLNRLIQSNNITRAGIYTLTRAEFTLTANQVAHTIGMDPAGILTADLNAVRPARIKDMVVIYDDDSRSEPMTEIDREHWVRRPAVTSYGIPGSFYYDPSYPFGTIYFDPGPGSAYTIEMWSWLQSQKISSLYDPVSWPDGYADFWMYQLAVRLCNPFGKRVTAELAEQERRAIARITAHNIRAPYLGCEASGLNE